MRQGTRFSGDERRTHVELERNPSVVSSSPHKSRAERKESSRRRRLRVHEPETRPGQENRGRHVVAGLRGRPPALRHRRPDQCPAPHRRGAAAILGHDGAVWAQPDAFPQALWRPLVYTLGGSKYMVIQGEPGVLIRGKKDSQKFVKWRAVVILFHTPNDAITLWLTSYNHCFQFQLAVIIYFLHSSCANQDTRCGEWLLSVHQSVTRPDPKTTFISLSLRSERLKVKETHAGRATKTFIFWWTRWGYNQKDQSGHHNWDLRGANGAAPGQCNMVVERLGDWLTS